jgi:type IV pilus assembly protein PilB
VGSIKPAAGGNGASSKGPFGGGQSVGGGNGDIPSGGGGRGMPPIEQLKGRPLGRVLIKMGRLTREQVHQGLSVQADQKSKGVNTPIGQILVDLGLISEKDRNLALAAQMGYEMYDLVGKTIPKDVLERISAQMATSYKVIPVEFDPKNGGTLKVVLASPENFRAVDDIQTFIGMKVVAAVADADEINRLLAKHYDARQETLSGLLSEITSDETLKALEARGESIDLETLKDLAESNPVKRLLNMVLLQAIKEKASDIHFEPFEDEFKMRYRIDGVLYEMIPPPKHIAMAITSRIKVMANLDIAERRMPQDGRIPLVVSGKAVDLRVAVLPTIFGESVVMRILDRSNVSLDLDKIGMRDDDLRAFRQ